MLFLSGSSARSRANGNRDSSRGPRSKKEQETGLKVAATIAAQTLLLSAAIAELDLKLLPSDGDPLPAYDRLVVAQVPIAPGPSRAGSSKLLTAMLPVPCQCEDPNLDGLLALAGNANAESDQVEFDIGSLLKLKSE